MQNTGEYVARRTARASQVLSRAMSDADFRAALVADPRAALSAEYGFQLPEEADVRVFEESANSHYLVIPRAGAESGAELTDEQLETIAGGIGIIFCTLTLDCFSDSASDT